MTNILVKPLSITASVFGIVQGLLWITFAIFGILLHTEVLEFTSTSTAITSIATAMFQLYFRDDSNEDKLLLNPGTVFIIVLIYLTLSMLWILDSCYIIWCIKSAQISILKNALISWFLWTILISVYDLLVTGGFVHDFVVLNQEGSLEQAEACGIMILITSKWVVLWIVNLVLAVSVLKVAISLSKTENQQDRPHIDAYNEDRTSNFDVAADWDTRIEYPRSTSFTEVQLRPKPKETHNLRTFRTLPRTETDATCSHCNAKTATTSLNRNYIPRIPKPDYSPRNSSSNMKESFRSALKTRSDAIYGATTTPTR